MTSQKFYYSPCSVPDIPGGPATGTVYRPLMPVTFVGRPRNNTFLALVDTGADECCFPGEIATYYGHSLTKGKPRIFSGIAGQIVAYLHQTDVEIMGHRIKLNIYYSDEWNANGVCLLGQNSFLTRFNILFNRKDREFTVTFRG